MKSISDNFTDDILISDRQKLRKASTAVAFIMIFFILFINIYDYALFFGINFLFNDYFEISKEGLSEGVKFFYNFLPNMRMIENFTVQVLSLVTSVGLVSLFYKFKPLSIIFKDMKKANNYDALSENLIKKSSSAKLISIVFPIIIALNFITNLIITLVTKIIQKVGVNVPEVNFDFKGNSTSNLIVYFISLCIFAPIIEEFLLRGCVLKILKPFGNWFAIIVPAIFFALLHGNIGQAFGAFFIGIILGFVAVKTGSIIPCIVLHSLNNFLPFFMTTLNNIEGYNSLKNIIIIGYLLFIFYGFYLIFKKANEFKLESGNTTLLSQKSTYMIFLTNIGVMIYIAYEIYYFIKAFVLRN